MYSSRKQNGFTLLVLILSLGIHSVSEAANEPGTNLSHLLCSTYTKAEKLVLPPGVNARAINDKIQEIMRLIQKNGSLTTDEVDAATVFLIEKAKLFLEEAGIRFEVLPGGQAIRILPAGGRVGVGYPNLGRIARLAQEAKPRSFELLYAPRMLLTDISQIENPLLHETVNHLFISHLDLLHTPKSRFFRHQIDLIKTRHFHGTRRAPDPLTRASEKDFQDYLRRTFVYFERTSIWKAEKQEEVARILVEKAARVLREQGTSFKISADGLSLIIINDPAFQSTLLQSLRDRSRFLGFTEEVRYDPIILMKLDAAAEHGGHVENGILLHPPRQNLIYLTNEEILRGHLRYGTIRWSEDDLIFHDLNVAIARYLHRKKRTNFLQSVDEPVIFSHWVGFEGRMMGRTIDAVTGSVSAELFQDPFLGIIHAVHSSNPIDLTRLFDEFLELSSSSGRPARIGHALQLDDIQTFYDLSMSNIKMGSKNLDVNLPTPKIYLDALSAYLDFLEVVYRDRLGISKDQFKVLRGISNQVKKRSDLLILTRNPIVEFRNPGIAKPWEQDFFRVMLPEGVTVDQLSELHRRSPFYFSEKNLKKSWNFISGLILVTSRSQREKLPLEILHKITLPRPVGNSGQTLGVAEVGRMGSMETNDIIEYVKIAAVKLKAKRPRIHRIYIEVDGARQRLFSRYGFKDLGSELPNLGYYPSGQDKILYVDIDEFLKRALE